MKNLQPTNQGLRQGSAMLAVVIATIFIGIIIGTAIKGTVTELKINERHVIRMKSKLAAEAAMEYGAAELTARFSKKSFFDADALANGKDPLSIPASAQTHFTDPDVDHNQLKIFGGLIPPGTWTHLSATKPSNIQDPLKGKRVFLRDIELYGKGVASDGNVSITTYVRSEFQVRDAPLFANAIFYNGDLEINPGPAMDIRGPVHSNNDIWIGKHPSSAMTFHDTITAQGEIFHDEKRPVHIGGTIYIKSSETPTYLPVEVATGEYMDSNHPDWKETSPGSSHDDALTRWDGNVKDGQLGAEKQNVVTFEDYVPDILTTPGDETQNHGYALIEPILPSGHTNEKSDEQKTQKMAYKAGLILKVEHNIGVAETDTENYYKISAYKYDRANANDPWSDPVDLDADGNFDVSAVTLPAGIVGDPDPTMTSIEDASIEPFGRGSDSSLTTPVTGVTGGLYDHRENLEIHTFALDVGALKAAVEANDTSASGFNGTYDVSKDWNGVVYVEYPTGAENHTTGQFGYGTAARSDGIVSVTSTQSDLALMLIDAQEIPQPSGLGSLTGNEGFTLATNAPLYVVGSLNADGDKTTGDENAVDDNSEAPVAIIADTVTILSDRWGGSTIYEGNRFNSEVDGVTPIQSAREVRTNSSVDGQMGGEIAASIVSGTPNTYPTGVGSSSTPLSLGVVNLPRFLESWYFDELRIRGSLVSLYESEIRPNGAPTNFNDFYIPPVRKWGFSDLLKNGQYPPGTPFVRTYRRTAFEEVKKSEYDAWLTKWTNGTLSL